MSSRLQHGSHKKKPRGSWLRTVLELSLFGIWLVVTGMAGYFMGNTPSTECIQPPSPQVLEQATLRTVPPENLNSITEEKCIEISDLDDRGGLSYEEIQHQWSCKNSGNPTDFNKHLLPSDGSLSNTKWESVLSVDPHKFFEMYLSQYPGDTHAVQPVVIFSHKPLNTLEEAPEVCKVLDIAIVPDTPGVCVAVTETYHDVASYHMLHADRKPDGTFSLTSNYLEGRDLPTNEQYAFARTMLSNYFKNADYVAEKVNVLKSTAKKGPVIGCLVESMDDAELFENSLIWSNKAGISLKSIYGFTSQENVAKKLKSLGVQVVDITQLANLGNEIGPIMRRNFLQAWLAFAVSDHEVRMVWQSPATIWMKSLEAVVNSEPAVELLWAFKGRKDKRAAPFFVSFDFFIPSGTERSVHLMHELMLHFDLILAWKSLDAVGAYRLAENNARYGTTTHIFPPTTALHIDMMARDASKITEALASVSKPGVLVLPSEDMTATQLKALLKTVNLWAVKNA